MAEELEESEVMFRDQEEYKIGNNSYYLTQERQGGVVSSKWAANNCSNKKQRKSSSEDKGGGRGWDGMTTTAAAAAGSLPVDIPSNVLRLAAGYREDYWLEDEYDGGELVPPHVIVGRRIAGKMAFSVCTGNGRTLKGRDLSQVRNSILRLTGFLET